MTTDRSMVGAIPTPLGEERNSILPSAATGHQSEKREEMGQRCKLDAANTRSRVAMASASKPVREPSLSLTSPRELRE